jgi:hypothetical protein
MIWRHLLGADLGKNLDYTSLAVINMQWTPEIKNFMYHLIALDRIRGVDYPEIVKLIMTATKRLEEFDPAKDYPYDGPHVCMDASGLGAPIKDFLNQNHFFNEGSRCLWPVVFTGGEAARFDTTTHNYNVSKTLIISNFLSLMQHKRFDYAADLAALPLLEEEIQYFQYHATASGHIGMDAAPGKHADLICSIAIPLIIAELNLAEGFR